MIGMTGDRFWKIRKNGNEWIPVTVTLSLPYKVRQRQSLSSLFLSIWALQHVVVSRRLFKTKLLCDEMGISDDWYDITENEHLCETQSVGDNKY